MSPIPRVVGADPVVGQVLSDAFAHDPFMEWIFGRSAVAESLPTWWGWLVANAPEGAEVWGTDDGGAAALWYPPRHAGDPVPERVLDRADKGAAAPFVEMLTPLVGDRIGEILTLFAAGGEAHPPEPHWYLSALGTRRDRQGQGLGALLVHPMIDRCDDDGLGIYLESSNPRNIPFYHRLGFEVVGELSTPDNAVMLTGMLRAAR